MFSSTLLVISGGSSRISFTSSSRTPSSAVSVFFVEGVVQLVLNNLDSFLLPFLFQAFAESPLELFFEGVVHNRLIWVFGAAGGI